MASGCHLSRALLAPGIPKEGLLLPSGRVRNAFAAAHPLEALRASADRLHDGLLLAREAVGDLSDNPGCLGAVLLAFGIGPSEASQGTDQFPYRLRDDFLSPAERSFHSALTCAVGDTAVVCPKVNLSDVFFVARPHENKGARGRISQKHVDFLLCNPTSMRPMAGVELDDSSHQRPDRQDRDHLVDAVFSAANLPLVRVPVKSRYSVPELRATIGPHLGTVGSSTPLATADVGAAGKLPVCPKCGIPMVLRISSRSNNRGSRFYGCTNFPRCRETQPAD